MLKGRTRYRRKSYETKESQWTMRN